MKHIKHTLVAYAGTAVLGLLALAPSSAQATCTKTVYVHYVSFGFTDYSILLNNKNTCWGLESPFYSGGSQWSVCSASSQPSGGTRWAYNEVTNPSTDQTHIQTCRSRNGGANDTVYVTPNSGGTDVWSHSGITGVNRFFNECYNSGSVNNQWLGGGCIVNSARPMWNLAQAQIDGTVSNSVYTLCHYVSSGTWIGFYSNGLDSSHTTSFYQAMNYCTTH
jgi:hypothetical protein